MKQKNDVRKKILALLALGALITGSAPGSAHAVPRIVVKSGDTVPCAAGDERMSAFGLDGSYAFRDLPKLNDRETILTPIFVSGTNTSAENDRTLMLIKADGTLWCLARTGSAVPGAQSGTNFEEIGGSSLGQEDEATFLATYFHPNVGDLGDQSAVFRAWENQITRVAHREEDVPNRNGVRFDIVGTPSAIAHGGEGLVFQSSLVGSDITQANSRSEFYSNAGILRETARIGDSIPGVPDASIAVVFDSITAPNNRRLVHVGTPDDEGNPYGPSYLVLDNRGNRQTIAGRDIQTQGIAAGNYLGSFRPLHSGTTSGPFGTPFFGRAMNRTGDIAFAASVYSSSDQVGFGIWRLANGDAPVPVIVTDRFAQAPGLEAGARLGGITAAFLTDNGDIIFKASWNRSNPSAGGEVVYHWRNGTLRVVTQTGRPALGIPDRNLNSIDSLRVNNRGELLFLGTLSGGGYASRVIALDRGTGPLLLARPGSVLSDLPNYRVERIPPSFDAERDLQLGDGGHVLMRLELSEVNDPYHSSLAALIGTNGDSNQLMPIHIDYRYSNLPGGFQMSLPFARATFPNGINESGKILVAPSYMSSGSNSSVRGLVLLHARSAACHQLDLDFSGNISSNDLFAFLQAYFSGNQIANINFRDGITAQDIFDFLTLFFANQGLAGC